MKRYMTTFFIFFCLSLNAQVTTIIPGSVAPGISLLNVNDKVVSFGDYPAAKGFIVIFTSNTCPYSKAYEQRIIDLDNKYAPLGFPVIAINPNDPVSSPGDSFGEMKKHAKSNNFTFPYLYDKDQVVTNAYGARSTPHVFVVNKTAERNIIAYTGALDNDIQNADPAKIKYAEDAISALLNNKKPAVTVTRAIGCRVSRKKT